jgi:hypothetical protein
LGALPYSLYFVEDGRVHEDFQECLVETGFPADGGQQEYQDHRAPRESVAYKGQHEREESLVREENEVYRGRERRTWASRSSMRSWSAGGTRSTGGQIPASGSSTAGY